MNFDLNIILVPLTLIFALIWLVDKFKLKQRAAQKKLIAQAKASQTILSEKLESFSKTLSDRGIVIAAESFVPNEDAADVVKQAYTDYQVAKSAALVSNSKLSDNRMHFLVQWAYEFLPVLFIILVLRSFVFQPFVIPSSSMVPTLYTGDFVLVNKYAYGLRLPILEKKILDTGKPEHGDVMVFRYPKNTSLYYIKRVIGLPGDTVAFNNGVLSINGKAIDTKPAQVQMSEDFLSKLYPENLSGQILSPEQRLALGQEEEQYARYFSERLGNHTYRVRYLEGVNSSKDAGFLNQVSPEVSASQGNRWQITVPEGKYFVMGDNRDRSEDARFWGFVDDSHLAGRATYIWMHKNAGWHMPSFDRVGKID